MFGVRLQGPGLADSRRQVWEARTPLKAFKKRVVRATHRAAA